MDRFRENKPQNQQERKRSFNAQDIAKDFIDRNVIPKSLPWFTALQDKMLTMGVFIADANFDKNYEGKITESKLESQRREVMFQKWLWQKKITQDNWANLNPLLQKDLLRDFSKWYKDQETSK